MTNAPTTQTTFHVGTSDATAPDTTTSHEAHVTTQFGPRAAAYVTSTVHAQGEDLQALATAVASRGYARVLDLGCGGGHVAFTVAPHVGEVVAFDLSDEMLAAVARTAAERNLTNIVTRQGAVEALPFPDASFDLVASRYSAHHWRGFHTALREARRVLRPGGHAIFMDIAAPEEALCDTWMQSIELLRDPSHVRDYSQTEWGSALTHAGFRPGTAIKRRLRLDFASWIARMATPEAQVQAIRALMAQAPEEVRRYLELEIDGSFTLDSLSLQAEAV